MVYFAKLDDSEEPDDWRKEIVQISLMNIYERQKKIRILNYKNFLQLTQSFLGYYSKQLENLSIKLWNGSIKIKKITLIMTNRCTDPMEINMNN